MSIVIPNHQNMSAVILAGGRANRMQGEDKGLLTLANKPLIAHVIERLTPQIGHICISANRNQAQYAQTGLPVISDLLNDYPGPLAGIYSALAQCESEWLVVVPCDTPGLPTDLVKRLCQAVIENEVPVAVVHDGHYLHATFCLVHRSLQQDLLDFLQQGERKTRLWLTRQPHAICDFSDQPSAFVNINTPEELAEYDRSLIA